MYSSAARDIHIMTLMSFFPLRTWFDKTSRSYIVDEMRIDEQMINPLTYTMSDRIEDGYESAHVLQGKDWI